MKILIVEDNEVTRKNLCTMLRNHLPMCTVFEAHTGKQAIETFKQHTIDIFFLDIELPDMTGIHIAEVIRSMGCYEFTYIIFTTTHIQYLPTALQKYHCYDFIEKPYKVQKIINTINQLAKTIHIDNKLDEKKFITIESGTIVYKLFVDHIIFAEIQGRNILVHMTTGQQRLTNKSLRFLKNKLKELDSENFIQSHKSYLVNIKYIKKLEKQTRFSGEIIFNHYNLKALIGDKYKEHLIEMMKGVES